MKNKQILIISADGFIRTLLTEALVEEGAKG